MRNGPRLFGFGTEAFRFAAASSLGCRATHIPLSAPRFAISWSPPQRYYVLHSRSSGRSAYHLSIRFTSPLSDLPFSTFQFVRMLVSCSDSIQRRSSNADLLHLTRRARIAVPGECGWLTSATTPCASSSLTLHGRYRYAAVS